MLFCSLLTSQAQPGAGAAGKGPLCPGFQRSPASPPPRWHQRPPRPRRGYRALQD